MCRALGITLVALWFLAVSTGHTAGGFVHVLLIAAILLFVLALIKLSRVA